MRTDPKTYCLWNLLTQSLSWWSHDWYWYREFRLRNQNCLILINNSTNKIIGQKKNWLIFLIHKLDYGLILITAWIKTEQAGLRSLVNLNTHKVSINNTLGVCNIIQLTSIQQAVVVFPNFLISPKIIIGDFCLVVSKYIQFKYIQSKYSQE